MSDPSSHLFEHNNIIVDPKQSPLRLDLFLTSRLAVVSRTRIQQGIRLGYIVVNDKRVKPSHVIKPGEEIRVLLPTPPRKSSVLPEAIPLDIVYEDDHLLVVNKAAEMVVHPGYGNWEHTLVNALVHHLETLPCKPGEEFRPGLVHRLDKGTSGLLVVAKSEIGLQSLTKQFLERSIQRQYRALVWGDLVADEGTIDKPIDRSLSDRRIMTICENEQGKHSVTHYSVLERFGYATLIACRLETGRTHQIRVHMQSLGHPLFGDIAYGGQRIVKGQSFSSYRGFVQNCFTLLPHQALHAYSLGFLHPTTKENIYLEAPLPPNFAKIIERWRRYTKCDNTGGHSRR